MIILQKLWIGDFILILACVKKTSKFLFGGKDIGENFKDWNVVIVLRGKEEIKYMRENGVF